MADPSTSTVEDKPVDPRKLFRAIIDSFNEDELKEFCFFLRLDYENLPSNAGKSGKARELILYFHRRNRLNNLVMAFREQRPHILLDDIILEETDEDPTQYEINIPRAPTAPPQDRSNTLLVGKSLAALIRSLNQPEVRKAVIEFQTIFEATHEQILLLNDYKLVHDLFQELENRYFLVQNDQRRLPADDLAWDSISINEPELQSKITDLLTVMQRVRFATEEVLWVQQLEKSKEMVRAGVEEYNLDELKAGTGLIYRILNRQPSRINAQLVATTKALRLDNLENAMRIIQASLTDSNIDVEVSTEVANGVTALSDLDQRINALVEEHDRWQEIDDELRRVEASLLSGIEELEDAWYDLEPMTRALVNDKEGKWTNDLEQVVDSLKEALGERVVVTVKRNFRRYRSQVGRRFREVDLELLSLCQDMKSVGVSLDNLLRRFNK